MVTETYPLLVTLHLVLFAYWLGGDWGVYVCSKFIASPGLPVDERRRFLDALLLIDILPRTAIVLLPVVGLQLAMLRGTVGLPAWAAGLGWTVGGLWLVVVWTAFLRRGTPFGEQVQRIDVAWRVLLIAALIAVGAWSLAGAGPFREGWMALKLVIYAALLVIGLYLRLAIRTWREGFTRLRAEGPGEAVNALFIRGRERARWAAYLFWALIILMGYLGVRQPF